MELIVNTGFQSSLEHNNKKQVQCENGEETAVSMNSLKNSIFSKRAISDFEWF